MAGGPGTANPKMSKGILTVGLSVVGGVNEVIKLMAGKLSPLFLYNS